MQDKTPCPGCIHDGPLHIILHLPGQPTRTSSPCSRRRHAGSVRRPPRTSHYVRSRPSSSRSTPCGSSRGQHTPSKVV